MNANDTLRQHTCTDQYYHYNCGTLLTDGAKALADEFQAYWFLDIIASYQRQLRHEYFQVWCLTRYDDGSAIVTCTDGNGNKLQQQVIDLTDIQASTATIWVENNVLLLPSEH